jgi:hypothetical protein
MPMKVGKDYFAVGSSFLSLEKDAALIAHKMLENEDLMKLIYYTEPDCLKAEDLTFEQKASLINNQIRIVPKIDIEEHCPNQVLIMFDSFEPNLRNPEFRDCNVIFNILCHPDHWNLGNFQLRPYKIAGHIDAMFNKRKLTGIGTLQFDSCSNLVLND